MPAPGSRVGVVQRQIANVSDFAGFFPDSIKLLRPPFWGGRPDVLVGWGLRRSGVRARRIAARHSLGAPSLEDGFLPSAGLAWRGANPQRVTAREGTNAA
jgi:capsule polysaccharide export protein KpsC/LpsZ